MASLKVGADLVTVFTASEAAIPIKCYSPELMVAPVYTAKEFDDIVKQLDNVQDLFDMFSIDNDDGTLNNAKCESDNKVQHLISSMVDEVVANMDKLHVLVIGPGLGRCPLVLEATSRIIQAARRPPYNLSLVLDADALYLLTLPRYQNVLLLPESSSSLSSPAHPPPIVLTPNVMEKKRLDESAVVLPTDGSCIVIEKGRFDEIRQPKYSSENNVDNNSDDDVFELKMSCGEEGGLKRSGGIGDILSGTVGTLLGWNRILTDRNRASGLEDVPLACWTACCFVRRSTKRAFDVHRRGMTAPDILHELAPTINGMTTST
jgi:ATP-dependent NAD(P)H-hydrate dehydratase